MPAKSVTVNVSEHQLEREDFLDELLEILSSTGLDPGSLELDITERALMKDPERTSITLRSIKDKGVKVSADNFGATYSSVSSLRKIPLDALKIDGALIRRVASDLHKKARVKAIIDAGLSMKLQVIAGGVETAEDREFLWEHGCEQAQGNYFGHAMPPQELAMRFETY